MNGQGLRVFVDGTEVWEGNVGPEAVGLAGPVGIRSDNVQLEFDLVTNEPMGRPDHPVGCKSGPSESE
jgi:hypothetical protein